MVSLHLGMCVCAFADKERMSMYRYFCLSVLQGDLCIAANSIQFQHFLALHQHSLPFNLLLPFIGRRCSHDYFWFQHLRGFVFMHHCIEEFSICVMERTHSCIHTAHADACVLRVNHFTIEARFFFCGLLHFFYGRIQTFFSRNDCTTHTKLQICSLVDGMRIRNLCMHWVQQHCSSFNLK